MVAKQKRGKVLFISSVQAEMPIARCGGKRIFLCNKGSVWGESEWSNEGSRVRISLLGDAMSRTVLGSYGERKLNCEGVETSIPDTEIVRNS